MGFVGDIVSGVADILPDPLGIGNMLGLTSKSQQGAPGGPKPVPQPQGFMGSMAPPALPGAGANGMGEAAGLVGGGSSPSQFRISQWNDPNKNRF